MNPKRCSVVLEIDEKRIHDRFCGIFFSGRLFLETAPENCYLEISRQLDNIFGCTKLGISALRIYKPPAVYSTTTDFVSIIKSTFIFVA